jgi:hypothetical protein
MLEVYIGTSVCALALTGTAHPINATKTTTTTTEKIVLMETGFINNWLFEVSVILQAAE